MKKVLFFIMATLLLISLSACIASPSEPPEGLKIAGWSTSIGSVDGGPEVQLFSYTCTLQNFGRNNFYVQWIEPVLGEIFYSKVLDKDLRVAVNQMLSPKDYVLVSGNFRIDTKGLSKEDILKMTALEPGNFQAAVTTILDLHGSNKK
jgi:hypothetical protein